MKITQLDPPKIKIKVNKVEKCWSSQKFDGCPNWNCFWAFICHKQRDKHQRIRENDRTGFKHILLISIYSSLSKHFLKQKNNCFDPMYGKDISRYAHIFALFNMDLQPWLYRLSSGNLGKANSLGKLQAIGPFLIMNCWSVNIQYLR